MPAAAEARTTRQVQPAREALARDLALAFVALELELSSLAQEALAEGALGSLRARREFHRRARDLVEGFRLEFRDEARAVLETAYDRGARTVGARPMGLVRRQALAAIVDAATARLDSSLVTVGRRFDDTFRRVGLQQAARQLERELPERAAADVMRRELLKRGLTGFVDKRGHRWRLQTYSEMVIETTTSEAANRGVADAIQAVGRDLVRVNRPEGAAGCGHHPSDPAHPCRALEGKVLSLTGRTPGYPRLLRIPPFHPRCRHGIGPASEGS